MPSVSALLAFSGVAVALIAVPGPSVLFVIARAIANGRLGGVVSVLGNALGGLVLVIAVAFGLGALLATSELLFAAVKLLGAGYLVYLGVQAVRRRKRHGLPAAAAATRKRTLLRQGFVVGVSNPKTAVFFAAILPQFVDYRIGGVPVQLAALGLLFLLIAMISDSIWALVAGTARTWFARSPKRMKRLELAGGATMIGLGGLLAAGSRAG